MEPTTINSIIEYFEGAVAERKPLSPQTWIDGAAKLNVLKGEEYDKLFLLEQACAKMEAEFLERDMTSARAKTFVKSSESWLAYKKQQARVKQIEDFILLAKKQASLTMEAMRNNLE